jgi:hypothetical protein
MNRRDCDLHDLAHLPHFEQLFSTSVYYICHLYLTFFFFFMSLSALLLLFAPHVLISGLGDERSQCDKWELTGVLFTNLVELCYYATLAGNCPE